MKKLRSVATIAIIIVIMFLIVGTSAGSSVGDYDDDEQYLRGRVLSVVDREIEPVDGLDDYHYAEDLEQELKVLITGGPHKGEVVYAVNYISDLDIYCIYVEEGMEVILVDFSGDLSSNVYFHDIARDRTVYYLVIAFAALLVLIGGMRGLKALITLAFTGFYIVKVFLPLVIEGYNPVIVSVASAVLLVVVTLLVIGGINRKSYAAIIGTISGLLIAGFLSLVVGNTAHLSGLSTQEAQQLFFFHENINIRELLFAGIIIGALGAIIDVGMSVASAAAEIKKANPHITFAQLVKSSLNVGRDIMATMSNTMILAYVGAAIPLLLLIMSSEMPMIRIMNFEFIATEIVRGITISIGLIFSVPVTAIAAALFMTNKAA